MPQFLGREIKVTTGGELKEPVSFRLGDREYQVAEIVEVWHDHGFGAPSPYRKRWWQRHHRNYYQVKTTGGEVL